MIGGMIHDGFDDMGALPRLQPLGAAIGPTPFAGAQRPHAAFPDLPHPFADCAPAHAEQLGDFRLCLARPAGLDGLYPYMLLGQSKPRPSVDALGPLCRSHNPDYTHVNALSRRI